MEEVRRGKKGQTRRISYRIREKDDDARKEEAIIK